MGDVAVLPVPDASQLAQIAVCTAHTAQHVAGIPHPKVAMLSFSTKGSAQHEVVDKVVEATSLPVSSIRILRLTVNFRQMPLSYLRRANTKLPTPRLPVMPTFS